MRTIYWYLYFTTSLIIYSVKLKSLSSSKSKLSKEEYETKVNKIVSKWTKKQIKNSGAKIYIKGLENIPDDRALFISNHQSSFDIAILITYINKNKGFVAKEEMFKIPFMRAWMKELRCVSIDRNNMKKSLQAILEGIKILNDGYSMVIFPEGTRSLDGKVKEFKAGSFKLATKTGAPIVPITIDGSYRMLKSGSFKINPAKVYVTIHPAISVDNLNKEEQKNLPSRVQSIIESKLSN